jgi:hypothetical protein
MAATGAAAAEADPEALVDALNAIFGKHEGMRAAHANVQAVARCEPALEG